MYIWLKDGAEERLRVCVETDRSTGKKYIPCHGDPFVFPEYLHNIPADLIERVTFKERIYRGLRTDGIYRHEGAELVATTEVRVHPEMETGRIQREEWQGIMASAPTIATLKTIYTLFRQGKLQPAENWEAKQPSAEPKAPTSPESEKLPVDAPAAS